MAPTSRRFGKYRLLKRLGSGGMGEVFLAKLKGPSGFEKLVVIKCLLQHRRHEPRYVDMFFLEARVTAQLNHANIVQIYEVDRHDDTPYIAMEYVRGKSLRHTLDTAAKEGLAADMRPPRPVLHPAYIVDVIDQLCRGLAFAHRAKHLSGSPMGVIHRDINPLNILLTFSGEVKLIDFGIAKSELTFDKTQAGTIKGTVVYMSPEQSIGLPLDRRSDVFAVGICLYEMLTGQNPFHKEQMAASLAAIRAAVVPPLPDDVPDIAPFAAIVARALARAPEDRFDDCDAMAQQLLGLVQAGRIAPPKEGLGVYLQALFSRDIDDEQNLLGQTELIELDDVADGGGQEAMVTHGSAPLQTKLLPHLMEGVKTRALQGSAERPNDLRTMVEAYSKGSMADEPDHGLKPHHHFDAKDRPTLVMPELAVPELTSAPGTRSAFMPADSTSARSSLTAALDPHRPFWVRTGARARDIGAAMWSAWAPLPPAYRRALAATLAVACVAGVTWQWRQHADLAFDGVAATPVISETTPASKPAPRPLFPQTRAPAIDAAATSEGRANLTESASAPVGDEASTSDTLSGPHHGGHRGPGARRRALGAGRATHDVAASASFGASLDIVLDPSVAVFLDGTASGAHLNLSNAQGRLEFRSQEGGAVPGRHFAITVHYTTSNHTIRYTVEAQPWANVYGAGGIALGRTPLRELAGDATTVLEFKNPHLEQPQRITLHYVPH